MPTLTSTSTSTSAWSREERSETKRDYSAETAGPVFQRLPDYLANTHYVVPTDITNGPFQYGHNTDLAVWQWRKERPPLEEAFSNHMSGYHSGRPGWMNQGFYPAEERLIKGMSSDPDAVAIVDVGGGLGHDLQELKEKHPGLQGRFILQDRSVVIDQIKQPVEGGGIELTSHDFFTEQPIKGARSYFMHSVLHDWTDGDCQRILRHLAAAMKSGYSKLLINENVVPDRGADWRITSLDWYMMALASAAERTENEWRELLRSAGLRMVGIWTTDAAVESLIEAVLEDDDTEI